MSMTLTPFPQSLPLLLQKRLPYKLDLFFDKLRLGLEGQTVNDLRRVINTNIKLLTYLMPITSTCFERLCIQP